MQSLWNEAAAAALGEDQLALRVYSSRLLGRCPDLVLHGGGNTSLKRTEPDFFGAPVEVLHIKGSGADLATVDAAGFAPVRQDVLLRLAELPALSDREMVRQQRAALLEPAAPTPSVEAILHALIPLRFVDHTHADAVVTLSNASAGERMVRDLYGPKILVLPYVMPGFALARQVREAARRIDWRELEGIVLLHHGVVTFGDTARESYERMIAVVSRAEEEIARRCPALETGGPALTGEDLRTLASLRREVSRARGGPVLARAASGGRAGAFAGRPDAARIATHGPLTPDHVLRTKRIPLALTAPPAEAVAQYGRDYRNYYQERAGRSPAALQMLDPAPRWAVWPGRGTIAFGASADEVRIVADIAAHTIDAIERAEGLGGWQPLAPDELFAVEYWELEQAKLKGKGRPLPLQGKVALVTGAASGIGRACVEALREDGAAVAAWDVAEGVKELAGEAVLAAICDVTDERAVRREIERLAAHFGGLDVLVSNAGVFPPSAAIAAVEEKAWRGSLELNLTSHFHLLQAAFPFLKEGLDPSVVLIASKNVPAPGPGAAAYSAAKAGLTQLGRVAALEWGEHGIRVNMIHPNAVFDTGLWTPAILAERARRYGQSVDEYKRSNVLRAEVTSRDVARLVRVLAGDALAKTTGAQIPVDGGNERVI